MSMSVPAHLVIDNGDLHRRASTPKYTKRIGFVRRRFVIWAGSLGIGLAMLTGSILILWCPREVGSGAMLGAIDYGYYNSTKYVRYATLIVYNDGSYLLVKFDDDRVIAGSEKTLISLFPNRNRGDFRLVRVNLDDHRSRPNEWNALCKLRSTPASLIQRKIWAFKETCRSVMTGEPALSLVETE
jgi:hypothetical protein